MDLKEFVEYLMRRPWDDKEHPVHKVRVEFLKDPEAMMDQKGLFAAEDRAFISSLRPEEIAERAGINKWTMALFANAMNTEKLWPAPGNLRKHYWEDPSVCPTSAKKVDDVGTRWSRPEHRLHKVYSETLYKDRTNEFVVVGEGFLPEARMTFVHQGSPEYKFDRDCPNHADNYHSCSIRQVYMRLFIDVPAGAPAGPYAIHIANLGWIQDPKLGPEAQVYIEDHSPEAYKRSAEA